MDAKQELIELRGELEKQKHMVHNLLIPAQSPVRKAMLLDIVECLGGAVDAIDDALDFWGVRREAETT